MSKIRISSSKHSVLLQAVLGHTGKPQQSYRPRPRSLVQAERAAVIDLIGRGIPRSSIGDILKIPHNRISYFLKPSQASFSTALKGPFKTREERIAFIEFLVRLCLSKEQCIFVMGITENILRDELLELKRRNAGEIAEFPLQQIFLIYGALIGRKYDYNDMPDIPPECKQSLVMAVDDRLYKQMFLFMQREGSMPNQFALFDPYDSIASAIGSQTQWSRTPNQLWRETFDDIWAKVRSCTVPLPEMLDVFLDVIDKAYKTASEKHRRATEPYRLAAKRIIASMKSSTREKICLAYGLNGANRLSPYVIAEMFGVTYTGVYIMKKRYEAKVLMEIERHGL